MSEKQSMMVIRSFASFRPARFEVVWDLSGSRFQKSPVSSQFQTFAGGNMAMSPGIHFRMYATFSRSADCFVCDGVQHTSKR